MLKNSLFSPLCSAPFLFQPSFSFSFSAVHFFFFSFSWSAAPFSSSLFFQPSFSFLLVCCPLFFSPKYFFFQPKRFSAQNVFASAQNFFQFSPKLFFLFQFSHSSLLLLFCRHVALLSSAFYFFSASFFSFL